MVLENWLDLNPIAISDLLNTSAYSRYRNAILVSDSLKNGLSELEVEAKKGMILLSLGYMPVLASVLQSFGRIKNRNQQQSLSQRLARFLHPKQIEAWDDFSVVASHPSELDSQFAEFSEGFLSELGTYPQVKNLLNRLAQVDAKVYDLFLENDEYSFGLL